MGVRARIIRTVRGFRCSRGLFACLKKKTRCGAAHDDAAATQAQSPGEDARRGAACCSAAEKPHSEQRFSFFLSLFFSSLLRLWEEKKNYEHRKRIKRRGWQPVFLLQSFIYVEVGCAQGCAEWTRAHRAETQSPLQSCSESLRGSPACLIVKEGGGRAKFLLREKGGNTLHKL